jgi:signal transduction histidine kinase
MPGGLTERDRRLLEAFGSLALGLELAELLKRVVSAACNLADAQYGALGVIGPDRLLVEFVHEGIDDEGVARIGRLPEGHGLLGLLIAEPHPLRLADLSTHAASFGFPPNHPPMRAFLGAPVRVADEVFGNIYLTNKRSAAEFTAEDEELIVALAATAGAAIANSRLLHETQRREKALSALQGVSTALLAGTSQRDVLALAANHARDILDADAASVVLRSESDGTLELAVGVGEAVSAAVGMKIPEASISGRVITSGAPRNLVDPTGAESAHQPLIAALGAGPVVFVPLWLHGETFGTLAVGRKKGRIPFTDADTVLVQSFATQASVALEYSRAQEQLRDLAVYEDEERIARDLHDSVIQQLFAVGMSLSSGLRLIDNPALASRHQQAIDDIDDTIRRIRSTIFSLGHAGRTAGGLRAGVVAVLNELVPAYGLQQSLEITGAIDAASSSEIAEQLTNTLREAISNAGRHARATRVDVELRVEGGEVILRVRDNGAGMDEKPERRSGLANMEERARALGGSMVLSTGAGLGTLIEWRVPTASDA